MVWRIPNSTSVSGAAINLLEGHDLFAARSVLLASTAGTAITMAPSTHRVIVRGDVVGALGAIQGFDVDFSRFLFGTGAEITGLAGPAVRLTGLKLGIDNRGLIETYGNGTAAALVLGGSGGPATETSGFVSNTGTIRASDGVAVRIDAGARSVNLQNLGKGLIQGMDQAYVSNGTTVDTFLNDGTINGNVLLGAGADLFQGETGNLNGVLYGGSGADDLRTSDTEDRLYGGGQGDSLFGGDSNDSLYGDGGNDTLDGGQGGDRLEGGDGFDVATYAASEATGVEISLVQPSRNDRAAAGDVLVGVEGVIGTRFDDVIGGNALANRLLGGEGDDSLMGLEGGDSLFGGAGKDQIAGDGGADVLYGDAGNDVLEGGAADDRLEGGTDDDSLSGDAGNDRLLGNAGIDSLSGDGGADSLEGGAGDDSLDGGLGDDTLVGGTEGDRLSGGAGNDVLTGGAGGDVFVFDTPLGAGNLDQVTDYDPNEDVLLLDQTVFGALTGQADLIPGGFAQGAGLTSAPGSEDYIIFNSTTGDLRYDPDGAGGAEAILFARLSAGLTLEAGRILIGD